MTGSPPESEGVRIPAESGHAPSEVAEPSATDAGEGVASRRRRALILLLGGAAALVVGGGIYYATLPDGSEFSRAWPRRTAYMELRIHQAAQDGRRLRVRYEPVPMSRIPSAVRRAVLVGEDIGFYHHGPFDWGELRDALEQAWREKESPRGASTITQQLARNLYLSPRRSLWRKLREALIAVRLEGALSKRRILELYLNVIELGPGIFGVEAASEHYFGVPIDSAGDEKAVELAATIPSPLHDNPATDTREFRWRVGLIAGRAFRPDTLGTAGADTAPGGARAGADTTQGGTAVGPGTRGKALPSPDTVLLPADTVLLPADTAVVDSI